MFGWLGSIIGGIASSFATPLLSYLTAARNAALDGFRTGAGLDAEAYKAWLSYQVEITAAKAAANSWWGPRVLMMIVGTPAALHTAFVFLDTTFTFGSGHYGSLGVPKLPPDYFDFEKMIVSSLFVVSTVGPMASAATAWLHRK